MKLKLDELNRVTPEVYAQQEKVGVVLLLDNVRSMHNIGAMFRTADAFNIEGIALAGICARPPHREIEKTALGATLTVPWLYFESAETAATHYKQLGYCITALEQTTQSMRLQDFKPAGHRYVLVAGNEVEGVSDEVLALCDTVLEIPQHGTKHSLNVVVAAGIGLWHLTNAIVL